MRAGLLRLDHSPETQDDIGRFGVAEFGSRSSSRRQGLMDPVHEVLGRSAFVSLTATAIALAAGVPWGRGSPSGRRRGRGVLATAVNTGMAVPTVVVGLVVALLLAKRSARQPGADLHPARDDHRPGPDRRPADRRDHDGGAPGAPAELPDQLRARREQAPARLPALDRGVPLLAAAMAGFGHAISEVGSATIVGGNIHGQTQVMRHVHRRAGRVRATSTTRSSTRRSCSRWPS